MATQVSSFLLGDGNGTSRAVMKLATSNRDKQEIATMGHCFRKCETTSVYLAMQVMDPRHALHEWHPVPC
jgi:hypothetical protein